MDRNMVMACGKTLKVIVTSDSGSPTQLMVMVYMSGVTEIGMRVNGGIH
jgi:hypothetical protein